MILMLAKLYLVFGMFFGKCKASDGIDLNLFKQIDYQVKFERLEMQRYNHDMFEDFSIVTFKYNRSLAVVNTTITPKIDLGNKISVVVQGYKFLSNEYRTFSIHFGANGCKAIAQDLGGMLTGFKRCGNFTGCPLMKGITYKICHWYLDGSKLPPLIPNGQYKIEMQVLRFSQEIFIMNMYGTVWRPIV